MLLVRLILALLLAAAPGRAEDTAADPHAVVQGMTISCHGWGLAWGGDEMVGSMEQLRELGVNWVAIHPYAGIRADGTVTMHERWYRRTHWLERPIAEAHRLGLKILIKPHLAYWGSPFDWRGEIAFETDEQWDRFFETYERWITRVAEICRDADGFAVGTELDRTVRFEDRWRRIVAAVRQRTHAPLTYAANWDAFRRVGFWDALDVIGIQGYFPLVAHDRLPDPAELDAGWDRLLADLSAYAADHHRKVLLAELGYNRSALAAVRPWDHRQGGAGAGEVQRRCLEAALRAIRRHGHETVVGAFLWKWFPGESGRGNFLMSDPAPRAVIGEHWGDAR